MSLLSPQLTTAERHLLYVANDKEGSKKSPADVEVRLNAGQANQSLFGNAVGSTFSAATKTGLIGLGYAAVSPFLSTKVRATVMGATYSKVIDAAKPNLDIIAGLVTGFKSSVLGANDWIVENIDSFGIPCEELPFTGEESTVGGWIGKVQTYLNDWYVQLAGNSLTGDKYIKGDIKIWKEAAANAAEGVKVEKPEQAASWLVGPRMINYFGSTIDTVNWMFGKLKANENYELYITLACVGGLAAWTFAQNMVNKGPAEQKAVDRLKFNFDEMLTTLKDMRERAVNGNSAIMKEELKNLAQGILENQSEIYSELSALGLSKLDYEKQKDLVQALNAEAQSIVENYVAPAA